MVFYQSPSAHGTLGGFVINPRNQSIGLLSCHHIIANGKKRPGDFLHTLLPTRAGVEKYPIARLGPSVFNEKADAAIGWLTDSTTAIARPKVPELTSTKVRTPKVGDRLTKIGYSSGITQGVVTELGYYPTRYGSQIVDMYAMYIEPVPGKNQGNPICQGGDSGAIWLDADTGAAVGLHFGGESNSAYGPNHAKACLMTHVLDALDVQLYLPQLQNKRKTHG